MFKPLPMPTGETCELLKQRFAARLRVIAKQSVTVWFNQGRVDKLLTGYIGSLEGCELLYAIDAGGRQMSSNIQRQIIDDTAYGQDLSGRPYVMNLADLNGASFDRAFAFDEYTSRETDRPCITVMHGVTSGSSLMGFIAADFYPEFDFGD